MAGKSVVILLGSPRRDGNCAVLSRSLARGVEDSGSRSETLLLQGMDIRPCTACEGCHGEASSGCVIEDAMQDVYPLLRAADGIVFASPVYWFSVSAQTKTVIDRLYAIGVGEGNDLRGKDLGVLMTYADSDPFNSGAVNALRMFQDISAYLGTNMAGAAYGSAAAAGEIAGCGEPMRKAYELGREMGK